MRFCYAIDGRGDSEARIPRRVLTGRVTALNATSVEGVYHLNASKRSKTLSKTIHHDTRKTQTRENTMWKETAVEFAVERGV